METEGFSPECDLDIPEGELITDDYPIRHYTDAYYTLNYRVSPWDERELRANWHALEWTVQSTNLNAEIEGVIIDLSLGNKINCSSAEHVVFHAKVVGVQRGFVVKFWRCGSAKLALLNKAHTSEMVRRYNDVQSYLLRSGIWGVEVAQFLVVSTTLKGEEYFLWVESFQKYFMKFTLKSLSPALPLSFHLSVSGSPRIRALQEWMSNHHLSPIIDVQGGYDPHTKIITLSDIETAESLSQKFGNVDKFLCVVALELARRDCSANDFNNMIF